jgi:transposase-like protein
VKRYPESLKQDLLRKLMRPNAPSATELASRTGISHATLSRWLKEASKVRSMSTRDEQEHEEPARKVGRSTRDLSPEDKLSLVQRAAELDEAGLGAFLRREGVHEADLTLWREQASEGALGALAGKRQRSLEQKRIRKLEAELKRKEKALAEAAALLVLSKKMQALYLHADNGKPMTRRMGCRRLHAVWRTFASCAAFSAARATL